MKDENSKEITELEENGTQPKNRIHKNSIITAIIAGGMAIILGIVGIGTDFGWRTKRQLDNQLTGRTRIQGAFYEGEMNWGVFEGAGTLTCDSGVTLSGNWDENYLQGEGTARFDDGSHQYRLFCRRIFATLRAGQRRLKSDLSAVSG